MIRLGEIQQLKVVKKVEFGVYLADAGNGDREEKVLLPAKQAPENTEIGDMIEIFAYKDSKDRLIATTRRPKLTLGQVGELQVAQVGKIGAFWTGDWKRNCCFLLGNRRKGYRKAKRCWPPFILIRAAGYARR